MIEFETRQQDISDSVVVNCSPKKLLGKKTDEERSWHYGGSFAAQISAGPAQIGPDGDMSVEGSFTRTHQEVVSIHELGSS